jgi:hypothetical protein
VATKAEATVVSNLVSTVSDQAGQLTAEARGVLSGTGFSRSGSTYTLAGLLAGAAVIQTSLDTTAGRLLSLVSTTGAFGLGGTHGPQLADLDATGIPAGLCFFNTSGGSAGTNPGFAFGAVIVVQGIGSGTQAPMMIAPERSAITNWISPSRPRQVWAIASNGSMRKTSLSPCALHLWINVKANCSFDAPPDMRSTSLITIPSNPFAAKKQFSISATWLSDFGRYGPVLRSFTVRSRTCRIRGSISDRSHTSTSIQLSCGNPIVASPFTRQNAGYKASPLPDIRGSNRTRTIPCLVRRQSSLLPRPR